MKNKKPNKGVNRRQFLRNSAAFAAGAAAFPYVIRPAALGLAGTVAPSNRIVMATIGAGNMGTGDMRGFVSSPDVQMVAVCDVDKKRRESACNYVNGKYGNKDCEDYLDFRDLLAREDLDAVTIALPDHWHGIISVAAADRGLDIYGQKPLARTIKEGRAICDAVKRNNIVWQTGSQQRSDRRFRHACELVKNGRIGKVKYVEVGLPNGGSTSDRPVTAVPDGLDWDFWLGPAPKVPYRGISHWNWRWIMDYSGGQLTDWAGHHIDIAQWGMGFERTGPVEIEGMGRYPESGIYNVPYEYKFKCKYKNGVEIVVSNDAQASRGRGPTWFGDKGWIQVNRSGIWAENPEILKDVVGPNEMKLYESRNHKQNFLDCIKTRKETVAPVEIGHRSISVALLGEIAMLTGKKLKWDPEKEIITNDKQANRMLQRPMRSPWHL